MNFWMGCAIINFLIFFRIIINITIFFLVSYIELKKLKIFFYSNSLLYLHYSENHFYFNFEYYFEFN